MHFPAAPTVGGVPQVRLVADATGPKFSKRVPSILERAAGLGVEAALQEEVDSAGEGGTASRGNTGTKTGRLQDLPVVAPSEEHLNSATKRAVNVKVDKGAKWKNTKLRDGKTMAVTLAAMKLDRMTKELAGPMKTYVKGFPDPDRLHPFERALLDLTLGVDHYSKTLGRVDATRKSILEVGKQYASKAAKARNRKEAAEVEAEGLETLQNMYKKGSSFVDRLKQLAKQLRRLPVVETETPTIALVGAPNVGKSSLVQTLSSGQPEICDYPFTTRTIKMGHFYVDGRRHQVTDTPGLLARSDEERNAMEMLTVASLAYLPTSVMFVVDLTEQCGTTAAKQWKIRCELRRRFPTKPWVDVISKSDLLTALLQEADAMAPLVPTKSEARDDELVNSPLDLARALTGAMRVSSITGDGIEALQDSVLVMVEEAYALGLVNGQC